MLAGLTMTTLKNEHLSCTLLCQWGACTDIRNKIRFRPPRHETVMVSSSFGFRVKWFQETTDLGRFKTLTLASLKIQIFWNIMQLVPDILNGHSGWPCRTSHDDPSIHHEPLDPWHSNTSKKTSFTFLSHFLYRNYRLRAQCAYITYWNNKATWCYVVYLI